VTSIASEDGRKAATAARMYDYFLGGTHNYPADRAAADAIIQLTPIVVQSARVNRAFLRRSVRYLVDRGVRQFLDIGSGIPTAGNVHEIAQIVPDARVVYVDIDPVAVAESQEILDGNEQATALRGDLRDPEPILDHPELRRLIDFDQPVGLLLAAVLHFVSDDQAAYDIVATLVARLTPGSYLAISHGAVPTLEGPVINHDEARDVYRERTTTPVRLRERAGIERFFTGLDLVEPGLVWAPRWRPAPDDPTDFADNPEDCSILVGVAHLA
jgi:SAM-dependent methyltransferase